MTAHGLLVAVVVVLWVSNVVSQEDRVLPNTLVSCRCGADEVDEGGACQPYPRGTFIMMADPVESFRRKPVLVSQLRVVVRPLNCEMRDHRQINFPREQFHLRHRGDLVLEATAGDLQGLRIDNYCVRHYIDEDESLTWEASTCIPPPDVPTCCASGHALVDGACQPADVPALLTPPIHADPYRPGNVAWPMVLNHVNNITCPDKPMTRVPLDDDSSYVALHTEGVMHIWFGTVLKQTFPADMCVDAWRDSDGAVKYVAVLCHEDPDQRYRRVCEGHTCVRKCCDEGEVMELPLYKCTDNVEVEFNPHMDVDFRVLTGAPNCRGDDQHLTGGIQVNATTGHLMALNKSFPVTNYCMDNFFNEDGSITVGALVCREKDTRWDTFRALLPALMVLSIIFLVLTIACYVAAPELLANGDWTYLCYAVAMLVAYTASVALQYSYRAIGPPLCIALALVKQFGWISTFIWLSTLCFDVWRLFRHLGKFQRPLPLHAAWYHAVAFGIPFLISAITLGLQYAPDDVPGLIKPNLGRYKCWFSGIEQLVFFYQFFGLTLVANCVLVGHTFLLKRRMTKGLAALDSHSASDSSDRRTDCYAELKRKFVLFSFVTICWVPEFLSWLIPPRQLWVVSDILNTLQGVFVFFILMQNPRKRNQLQQKFPKAFAWFCGSTTHANNTSNNDSAVTTSNVTTTPITTASNTRPDTTASDITTSDTSMPVISTNNTVSS